MPWSSLGSPGAQKEHGILDSSRDALLRFPSSRISLHHKVTSFVALLSVALPALDLDKTNQTKYTSTNSPQTLDH